MGKNPFKTSTKIQLSSSSKSSNDSRNESTEVDEEGDGSTGESRKILSVFGGGGAEGGRESGGSAGGVGSSEGVAPQFEKPRVLVGEEESLLIKCHLIGNYG